MTYDLTQRRPVVSMPGPATGRVVRSDESGVWVAPLGSDVARPIGPCRGAVGIAVGTLVLLVQTDQGPWVAGSES